MKEAHLSNSVNQSDIKILFPKSGCFRKGAIRFTYVTLSVIFLWEIGILKVREFFQRIMRCFVYELISKTSVTKYSVKL